jgi:PAS domain S-box-containing protein
MDVTPWATQTRRQSMTARENDDLSVLVVEDDPDYAELVRAMLSSEGGERAVEVTHASRLRDAMEFLESQQFSAVLLDLTLPDSEGLDTFVRARAHAPTAPIVVLTGLADEAVAAHAVRHGAQDYLVKGRVDSSTLYQSVRYAVERYAVTEQLRQSEERFRQLAENIKEAFVIADLPGSRAAYVSSAWSEIWGRPSEDAYRSPNIWLESIHADDATGMMESQNAVSRGERATIVYRISRPAGGLRWIRARVFPVFDHNGAVYRMVGLAEDITEIRQTEEQLQQAQKMEAVGRLAGGIAHDFNNLLSVILGFTELVQSSLGEQHPSSNDVEQIRQAANSAANLTRQLLAFSRRQILQPQTIDLNDVLRRVHSLLHRVIGEDVSLTVRLTEGLDRISADPGQIEQVIVNLAVNARDAMPEGGHLTIETANVFFDQHYAEQHVEASVGPHVMIAVSDNGMGMDEATQKRLFEPFFTTKGAGKGTGLGLATVYGIVRQSRGTIWVYSEQGVGTTFKIYFPAVEAPATPLAVADAQPELRGGSETVLVAEDQPELRAIACQILRRYGYSVIEASNGNSALSKARAYHGPIHVLLTDVVMPGMGGRQLAELLADERPEMHPIFMSGYTDDTVLRHGFLDSALAFIQKPFTPAALLRKVREVIDGTPSGRR